MRRREALRLGAERLKDAGIDNPRLEARLLLAHALGVEQSDLAVMPEADLAPDAFLALVARRAAREPLAYILGRREFWSLNFEVSPATLIPRPDSETLIAAALSLRPKRERVRRVLDLGTGTGCLLLAALTEFPAASGIGLDLVPAAAALARRNAARLGLAARAAFLVGDWAAAVESRFDLVLSNPPYVKSAAFPGLMADVADHEPASALDGGADGLEPYRRIFPELPRLLAPGGMAILEVGVGQAAALGVLAGTAGVTTSIMADLAGIPRALICPDPAMKIPFGRAGPTL